MFLRHIERFEVVIVVFDLGAFEHLVAEAREDRADFVANQAEWMAMAQPVTRPAMTTSSTEGLW